MWMAKKYLLLERAEAPPPPQCYPCADLSIMSLAACELFRFHAKGRWKETIGQHSCCSAQQDLGLALYYQSLVH